MNYQNQKYGFVELLVAVGLCALIVSSVLLLGVSLVRGAQTSDGPIVTQSYRTYEFFQSSTTAGVLNSVIATGTVGTAFSTGFTQFLDSNGIMNTGRMDIRGADTVNLYFTRGGAFGAASLGTTTFSVEVSPDYGTTWFAFPKLVQATGTAQGFANMQPSALIGDTNGATADATTTQRFSLDLSSESFTDLRCKVVTTVDGSASCMGAATFK